MSDPEFELTDELATCSRLCMTARSTERSAGFSIGYGGQNSVIRGTVMSPSRTVYYRSPRPAEWLRAKAIEHYPDSAFAKDYRRP